jgi:hypothetical protein
LIRFIIISANNNALGFGKAFVSDIGNNERIDGKFGAGHLGELINIKTGKMEELC